MSIVYDEVKKSFRLQTQNTAYIFHVKSDRFLFHNYYGLNCNGTEKNFEFRYYSFSPYPPEFGECGSLNDNMLEFSFFDSGDYRCCALKIRSGNGNCCTSFNYSGYGKLSQRVEIPGIPSSISQEGCETLAVYLTDEVTGCALTLYYTVFPQFDIITRYFTLENKGGQSVKIEKAMCLQLDLPGHSFDLLSLYGEHSNEFNVQRHKLFYGLQSVMSRRGASSHQLIHLSHCRSRIAQKIMDWFIRSI